MIPVANTARGFVLCLVLLALFMFSATSAASCKAEITVNTTYPSSAFYIYHDIIVENTGHCAISRVFVNITLPPEDNAFAYYNVSNQTGELFGFTSPMSQGGVEIGGTIVLNSARIPDVQLALLECSTSCTNDGKTSPIPTNAPTDVTDSSSTIQIELKKGSNPYWFGLNVIVDGEEVAPRKVQLRDSSSGASWARMDVAQWANAPTYTFSPPSGPLVLPITLRITSPSKHVAILDDIITSFSPVVFDSQETYDATNKRGAPAVQQAQF